MTPHVKIEELFSERLRGLLATPVYAHDAQRAHPCFVDGTVEEFLEFIQGHITELFGEGEHLSHAHPDKLVALAILTFAGFEVTQRLLGFCRRSFRFQTCK